MADKWFVRGVPVELTEAASAAARSRGVTIGRIVAEALRLYLVGLHEGIPPGRPITGLQERLDSIERRIAALEQLPERITALEALLQQPRLSTTTSPPTVAKIQKSNRVSARLPANIAKLLDVFNDVTGLSKTALVQEAMRRHLSRLARDHHTDDSDLASISELEIPQPTKQIISPYPWQSGDLNGKRQQLNLTMRTDIIHALTCELAFNMNKGRSTQIDAITQNDIYIAGLQAFFEEELIKWGLSL